MDQCVTRKRVYFSQEEAENALIDSWGRNHFSATNGPIGVYQCLDCGNWHWTSQGSMNPRLFEEIENGNIKKARLANDWEGRFR